MSKKTKQNISKVLFTGVFGLFIWIMVFFNLKITPETSEFLVKQNEWTTKLVNNFTTNAVLYIFIAVALLVGYLFAFPKKKR